MKSWGYPYSTAPPFDLDTQVSCARSLIDTLGIALRIPADGLIGLLFTIQGIGRLNDYTDRKEERLQAMKLFQSTLNTLLTTFVIDDHDPWTGSRHHYNISAALSSRKHSAGYWPLPELLLDQHIKYATYSES